MGRGRVMPKCIDCNTALSTSGLVRCDECIYLFIVNYKKERAHALTFN